MSILEHGAVTTSPRWRRATASMLALSVLAAGAMLSAAPTQPAQAAVAATCQSPQVLDWGTFANGASPTTATGGGVTYSLSRNDQAPGGFAGEGDYVVHRNGQQGGQANFYQLAFDGRSLADFEELILTPDQAAAGLQFTLLDVDTRPPDGNYRDAVRVTADFGGTPVTPTVTAVGSDLDFRTDGTTAVVEGRTNVPATSTNGNATVSFPSPVTSVTIRYSSGTPPVAPGQPGYPADTPTQQLIGIGNLSFCGGSIGAAKSVGVPTFVAPNYSVDYRSTLTNTGGATVYDPAIVDNETTGGLAATFGSYVGSTPTAPGTYTVGAPRVVQNSRDPVAPNPAYTGASTGGPSLLAAGVGSLVPGETVIVDLPVTFYPDQTALGAGSITYSNTAVALGDSRAQDDAVSQGGIRDASIPGVTPDANGNGRANDDTGVTQLTVTRAPALGIVKSFVGVDDRDGDSLVSEGDVLSYAFGVTNAGNVAVSAVVVVDPLIPDVRCPTGGVTPGGTVDCTGTYVVTAADVAAGEVVNDATASATVTGGGTVDSPRSAPVVVDVPARVVAVDEVSTGAQGATQVQDVLANDGDVDRSTLTLLDADGAPTDRVDVDGGSYWLDGDRNVVFQPIPTFSGTAPPVGYRVANAAGATGTATYTPTVTPVTRPDASTGVQGATQVANVLANDDVGPSASPLDPATLALVDPATGGRVPSVQVAGQGTYAVGGAGSIVFTPEPGFVGTATTVSYVVADGLGSVLSDEYTPTVTAVVPTAKPDTTSGPQGVAQTVDPFTGLGTNQASTDGADAPGDPGVPLDLGSLTLLDAAGAAVDSVAVPGEGTFTVDGSRIAFAPERRFVGTATPVGYRIADANGTTASSTYAPTVVAVAPVANPDTTSGPQGVPQTVDPFTGLGTNRTGTDGADAPGDPGVPLDATSLTLLDAAGDPVDRVTVSGEGAFTVDGSSIAFTPEPQFVGTATPVGYRIADANGTTASSTYTPTVAPVAPTANPDTTSGLQGAPQTVDPFTGLGTNQASTAGADAAGAATVPLDLTSLTLLDADGDAVDSVEVPGEGTFAVDGGSIVFTPEPQFVGTATPVGYRIADANGTTASSTYTPTVAPVTRPDASTGVQGAVQVADVLVNDDQAPTAPALDPRTLQLVDPGTGDAVGSVTVPGQGTFVANPDGTVTFTPEPDFVGTAAPVAYVVRDVGGTVLSSTYTPTVTGVAPIANPDTTSGPQGAPQTVDPFTGLGTNQPSTGGADAPGDPGVPLDLESLTLVDAGGDVVDSLEVPGQGTFTVDGASIVFNPEPGFTGTATPVAYRIADANGTTASSTYTPTVVAVTPVANPDTTSGPQGVPQTVDPFTGVGTNQASSAGADAAGDPSVPLDLGSLTLLDADGDPVDRVVVPGEGTSTVDGSTIVFAPEPQFVGTASPVGYRIADANGTTAASTYTPTVTPVAPTAEPDTTSGTQGASQTVDPFTGLGTNQASTDGADAPGDASVPLDLGSLTLLDADGAAVESVAVPGEGTFTIDGASIVFAPEPGFSGTATPVAYRVADANGTTASSTYTPTVTPVTRPDASTGVQGAVQLAAVLANDDQAPTAPALDPRTLQLVDPGTGDAVGSVTVPGQGTFVANPDGTVTFTPEPDFVGTAAPVAYVVRDVGGTVLSSTYTPTVTGVAPIANPDTTSGPQGVPQTVDPFTGIGTNQASSAGADAAGDPSVPLDVATLTLLDAGGAAVDSVEVPGEGTFTVDGSSIVFAPEPQFVGTASPVGYRIADANGTTASSTYTPTVTPVAPVANPDTTSGPQGAPQTVDPLTGLGTNQASNGGADAAGDPGVPLDATSLTLVDAGGAAVDAVDAPGEGRFTIDGASIVFTPEPQFVGTASPVGYRIADANGTTASSTYTPTVTPVAPVANPDTTSGPQGAPQTVDPFTGLGTNQAAVDGADAPGAAAVPLDRASLTLLGPDGSAVDSVLVPGEGEHSLDGSTIVFAPEPGFVGTATPVGYRIADANGTTASSTYTPTVTPVTRPDVSTGPQGAVQVLDVLANDGDAATGSRLDPSTLLLVDPQTGAAVASVVVPGEGAFAADPSGVVRFAPEPDFVGTATPMTYLVRDADGLLLSDTYTPTVTGAVAAPPVANPDATSGPQGREQTVDPLTNDRPSDASTPFVVETLTLLDEGGAPASTVRVPGQGTYRVTDGTLAFVPEPAFVGEADPVGYRISDAAGGLASSTYTPTVVAVPGSTSTPPPAASGGLAVTGGGPTWLGWIALLALAAGAWLVARRPGRHS